MSTPDLSKIQFTSLANSLKNDGILHTGTMVFPTTIASGSFVTVSTTVAVNALPQFSVLYAFFQEYFDTFQQYFVGSGYNTAQWYRTSVDVKIGFVVTAPAPQAGPLNGIIYPVIANNQVQVVGLINNPYAATITLNPVSVPWGFVEYSLTN